MGVVSGAKCLAGHFWGGLGLQKNLQHAESGKKVK